MPLQDTEGRVVELSHYKLWGLVFQAAGAATQPLLEDHPDYVFPSERVAENVAHVLEEAGFGPPPYGYTVTPEDSP